MIRPAGASTMTSTERHVLFATCAPGLEPVLHDELRGLRAARLERQVGGARFEGTLADAWRANLELRTAVRVLLRVARFPAAGADELYRGVAEVDWSRWLRPGGTLWVDAQSKDSALDHTRFVEQRTKDAVVDQVRARSGSRPDVAREDPDLRLHVHLFRDRATLSVDTSGASLHKRGWRRAQGRAPLAETLAAGLVLLSGWDRRAPLLDPFAGSGTIAVEAALFAAGVAPGIFRVRAGRAAEAEGLPLGFGFERLPGHDARAFAALARGLEARRTPPRKLRIVASDLDPQRVEEARANAAAAGVEELVRCEVADARELAPRPGWNAWIVTNPPYGERVGSPGGLEELYRAFGAVLRERCAGCWLALLTARPELARALGLARLERLPTQNGGIPCEILRGRLG